MLRDDRGAIERAVRSVLAQPPEAFGPGRPVFVRSPEADVLFAVVDEPGLGDDDGLVVVLAVQTPLSARTAAPGMWANCHWMTEIWPSYDRSIIPVTYEFARGARPEKRLNFVIDDGDGSYRRLNGGANVVTGFRHFVSAAYSRHGLAMLDFHLTVRHRPPLTPDEFPESQYARTRTEFVDLLRRDLLYPLAEIENELYEDRGDMAPAAITEIDSLFAKVLTQLTDTAYSNLDLFKQEWASNINPRLHERGVGAEIVVPVDELQVGDVDVSIGRTLVRHDGALASVLMLADLGFGALTPGLPPDLVPVGRQAEVTGALVEAGLVVSDADGLRISDRGRRMVAKLRRLDGGGVGAHG